VLRQADQVRRRIGVTFQDLVLDPDLTGRQVLDIHGRLYRQPRDLPCAGALVDPYDSV
jgi:ABC-2 type transport system ATP-binding protein